MQPKFLLFLLLSCGLLATQAQVSINTDASAPDGSAMLDIKSTAKGFLAPRMTSAQRTAIVTPAEGLWVYDTDTHSFWFYLAGTGWQQVTSGGFSVPYAQTYNYALPLFSLTNSGAGGAAAFSNNNSTNTTNVLNVTSVTQGVIADHSTGNAGNFFVDNTSGVGAGVRGEVNSQYGNNGTAGVYGVASGTGGYGGYFAHTNPTGFGNALSAVNAGQGTTVSFFTDLATNAQPTLDVENIGTGSTVSVFNTNATNVANTMNVTSYGPGVISNHAQGNTANFFINNTNGVGAAVRGETNSVFGNNGTAGIYGVGSGTGGYGGYFEHTETTGFGTALYARSYGLGTAVEFETLSATNGQPTLTVNTLGIGSAIGVNNTNTNSTANTVNVTNNGFGVIANHSLGNAGNFFMNNTNGIGAGVRGETNSLYGNAGAAGVYGVASGTGGYAGYFEHTETTGYGIALQVVNNDLGTAMVVDAEGPGNIAIFQKGGVTVARITNAGAGLFNGGLAAGGADLAEAFDVEGSPSDYSAGDVMLISTSSDRSLTRSKSAYSNLVAGVYATRPGLLLAEDSVSNKGDGTIPLGVVGVLPTKVCDENGPIHRGDILVTSSRSGYAMKADLDKLKPGQSIGKALAEFSGTTGMIKVLVNVK